MTSIKMLTVVVVVMAVVKSTTAEYDCNSTLSDVFASWAAMKGAWTCNDRCGETYSQLPCACDDLCRVYDDCCDDFIAFCSDNIRVDESVEDTPLPSSDDRVNWYSRRSRHNATSNDLSNSTTHKTNESNSLNATMSTVQLPAAQSPPVSNEDDNNQTAEAEQEMRPFTATDVTATTTVAPSDSTRVKRSRMNLDARSGLVGKTECRHRTKLVSTCPQPAVLLPKDSLLYGGKRIVQEELVPRCNTPLEQTEDMDALQALPVTDSASGVHFANVYCMLCHGGQAGNALPWTLVFKWNYKSLRQRLQVEAPPLDAVKVLKFAHSMGISTVASPPSGVIARRCFSRSIFVTTLCGCPRLYYLCQTMQTSPIYSGNDIFRNPQCLMCHVTNMLPDEEPKSPIEPNAETLVYLKNRFEFFLLMRWVTNPINSITSSLQLENENHILRMSFPWTKMTCYFNTTAKISDQDESQLRSGQLGGDREEGNPYLGQGEIKNTTAAQQNLNQDADPKTTEAFISDCRQDQCSKEIAMLNGECNADFISTISDVLLICKPHNNTTNITTTEKVESLAHTFIVNLTQSVHASLQSFENITVTQILATRGVDGCFWNFTIYLRIHASLRDTLNTKAQRLIYNAIQLAVREKFNPEHKQLYVCMSSFKRGRNNPVNTCTLSTIFLPWKQSGISSTGSYGETGGWVSGLASTVMALSVIS